MNRSRQNRRQNRRRLLPALVLAALAVGLTEAGGKVLFSEGFDDGELSGWTASGAGTWTANEPVCPRAAYHRATGQSGWIEHPLVLDSPEWSVTFDANWRWGSGNAGLHLSVWILDEHDNGYQALIIQTGDLILRRIDNGKTIRIAGPFNIGKLAGSTKLRRYRLSRSARGRLRFEFKLGDRWFKALEARDARHKTYRKIRLCEDTGKGCAIFDNIVVTDEPRKDDKAMSSNEPVQQALQPVNVDQFFIAPDRPAELVFCLVKAPSFFFNGAISYYITDYRDQYVASGDAAWSCGVLKVPVTLKQGYYTLTFPTCAQSFGVHAIPPATGKPDLFFGVDSAMSWFIKPERKMREGLVRVLARNGIRSVRGRVSWSALEPEKGKWLWDGECQYETLRKIYKRHGVRLLDMCEVTPKWNDPKGKGGTKVFLEDLNAAAESWETIARRWEPFWAGFEIWNEPDNNAYFNGGTFKDRGLPADQYTQFAKAISWAFHRAGVKTSLVGGCFSISILGADFAERPSEYHRLAARNGLLEVVDAVSFHSYSPATAIEGQVAGMRHWLEMNGKASMPIYLTESGVVPWSDGKTLLSQTAGLAMKMIEARVCGVARFYAFVYPPLPGGKDWRFGIMNYNGSPRSLMAGIVQATHALSKRPYIGDLRHEDPKIKLARVFGGADDAVVVFFTGNTDAEQVVKLGLPVQRIEGADGRALKPKSDGVPIPDGLAYVYVRRSAVEPLLKKDTRAMRLWKLAQQPPPKRPAPSPIILQPRLDKKLFPPTYTGYRVLPEAPAERLPITLRVFNLSARGREITLALTNPDLGRGTAALLARASVRVRRQSSQSVTLPADVTKGYRPGRKQTLWITARADGVENITPLVIDLKRELRLKDLLHYFASSTPLPITELTRWKNAGKSEVRFSQTADGCWRMDTAADAVARFRLPEGLDPAGADGFVLRARCPKNAKVWFSALDAEGKPLFYFPSTVFLATDRTYQTSDTFLHPDGDWHTVYVPFPKEHVSGARIASLQFGIRNLSRKDNALEISNVLVVRG